MYTASTQVVGSINRINTKQPFTYTLFCMLKIIIPLSAMKLFSIFRILQAVMVKYLQRSCWDRAIDT